MPEERLKLYEHLFILLVLKESCSFYGVIRKCYFGSCKLKLFSVKLMLNAACCYCWQKLKLALL